MANENESRLIPLTEWPKYHVWPPIGTLRELAFHRETNGFAKCIRKVGRRILIDERAFREWVDSQQVTRRAESTQRAA